VPRKFLTMLARSTTTRPHWGSAYVPWGTSMIIANIDDYRKQCEARLPPFLYDYISGGSYQENTLRANIAELQATLSRQRVLVDESHLDLSIHLWDQPLSLSVVLGRAYGWPLECPVFRRIFPVGLYQA